LFFAARTAALAGGTPLADDDFDGECFDGECLDDEGTDDERRDACGSKKSSASVVSDTGLRSK
jgi:hypothetical protein